MFNAVYDIKWNATVYHNIFRKGSSLVAAFTCSTLYILLAAI